MLSSPSPDACESLVLDVATQQGLWDAAGDAVVIDDVSGALTAQALAETQRNIGARVLSWAGSAAISAQLAALFPDEHAAGRLILAGDEVGEPRTRAEALVSIDAHGVLLRLPRSLRALDATTRALVRASRATHVVAGGNVKHMTRGQNAVLERGYREVRASLGRGKHRCLIAQDARDTVEDAATPATAAAFAVRGQTESVMLQTHGGVFGGSNPDPGSLLLLQTLDAAITSPGFAAPTHVVDFGCGNGLLTTYLARAFPDALLTASDDDADAVFATRSTAEANDIPADQLRVMWDTSLSRLDEASADLILLNPPFHERNAVDATLVQGMLDGATRVLRTGGELWLVHNSHLRYRTEVERRVGPTEQRARDSRFTVLRATRR